MQQSAWRAHYLQEQTRGLTCMPAPAEQKFADLANRVEMLETELIAMKLCKLKMEADKTSVEEHARQMEKTLATLQGTAAESAEVCVALQSGALLALHMHASSSPVLRGPSVTRHRLSLVKQDQAP